MELPSKHLAPRGREKKNILAIMVPNYVNTSEAGEKLLEAGARPGAWFSQLLYRQREKKKKEKRILHYTAVFDFNTVDMNFWGKYYII